jgi:hypothetical protein
MIPGVIADCVPGLHNLPNKLWVPLCGLANHEERRAGLMPLQDLEQAGRELGMRPVVKRERSNWISGRNMGNGSHELSRRDRERFAKNPDAVLHVDALLPLLNLLQRSDPNICDLYGSRQTERIDHHCDYILRLREALRVIGFAFSLVNSRLHGTGSAPEKHA